MPDHWMDADETADSLHITKATLYKLVRGGHVPAQKIGGKWRFTRAAIEELFVDGDRRVLELEKKAER
ncbi:MAG: helix-turn-helix domain-containing protein [bacterium]